MVNEVGPAEDLGVYVNLTDTAGAFTGIWFTATDAIKGQMLAVALTAISTGYAVEAALVSTDPYSACERLYVIRS
jgi:hypothetical protein